MYIRNGGSKIHGIALKPIIYRVSELSPQGTSQFSKCFDLRRFASFKEESSRQISFRVIYLSAIFFYAKLSGKSYILNCWELWKVDMLTIQKLYGLNITPMSKAIWEYKNELPSLHELARSLSEKGKDSLLKCTPEVQTGSSGNLNLTKNSLSWTKLIFIIFFGIRQHHMFSFNVNFNQSTVDFFGRFDGHSLVAALC